MITGLRTLFNRPGGRHIPIAYKIAVAISLLIVAGMTTLGALVIHSQKELLRSQTESLGSAAVSLLSESTKEPLLAGDKLSLAILTEKLTSDPAILGIAIIDANGNIVARNGITPFDKISGRVPEETMRSAVSDKVFHWETSSSHTTPGINVASFFSPIYFKDVLVGHILISMDHASISQYIRDSVRSITAATVLMIILAVIFSFLMGRRLTQPIEALIVANREIGKGHFHYRLDEQRNDEIGFLMKSFNNMASGLQEKFQVERIFSKYVSPKIARRIMRDLDHVELGGEQTEGSVLFADIVGYTALSGRMTPAETIEILNEYFSYIFQASDLYHGTIDKYMGDCAMIVFGVPEYNKEHRFNAVSCAILIQRIIESLNTRKTAQGLPAVDFRLGINSGEMLAGNMGARERMQFTVIGETVNLASKLCSISRPGDVVVTSELASHSELQDRIFTEPHKPLVLAGNPGMINTSRITNIASSRSILIDNQLYSILSNQAAA